MKVVSNFSGGITSAVAIKEALRFFPEMEIVFIDTGSHHPDTARFINDCSMWFGKEIVVLKSTYKNIFDVIKKTKFINSSKGAACTRLLKTKVRRAYENSNNVDIYIWGFEYSAKEVKRAERIKKSNPVFKHISPLIDKKITKSNALYLLEEAGIRKPKMYELGYQNNNCIGCVKGGMGYWNKIRVDFPEVFNEMVKLEKEIGHSCLKFFNGYETEPLFLENLDPEAGYLKKEIVSECPVKQLSMI